MTEQIEDDFWAKARAQDAAERGRQADPSACGTCRSNVEAGGQVDHDGCAQRATLLPAPDHPGYELITGLSEKELAALPARFHVPVFMDTATPNCWVCAVCWGEGWVTGWPCPTAEKHGTEVFTPEHTAETAAKRQAARIAYLEAELSRLKRRSYSNQHIWTVWREDQPAHAHYATLDDARQGSIDCWEEDEERCPDYSWRPDGPRLELLAGGEAGGVYISRADVFGTQNGPALPWAHAMPDDDLHGFLGDLVSAASDRWRSDPDVPDRDILANIEKVCAAWRTPGQGYRSDEAAAETTERRTDAQDCTTCEHHLPAMPAEEQCNPDGCGCIGYPEACDVRAAPPGAVFPISNCPSWQARGTEPA